MGLFQSIFNAGPQGHRLRKKKFRLMRKQAESQVQSSLEAAQTNKEETERGRAFLGQSLAGRGLSKSSIAEQDTLRYDTLAERRAAALNRRYELAKLNQKYVLQAIKYERKSVYAQLIDGVVSVFGGIGQGGGTVNSQFADAGGSDYGGGAQDYYGWDSTGSHYG